MSITTDQLLTWIATPRETQNLEFKKAETSFDESKLKRYCIAIANEGGGHLILGVTDKVPRLITGTKAFNNPQKVEEKLFIRLGFRVDIEEVNIDESRVLVFVIPSRPRGTAYHDEGAYLMRSGESLVAMSEDKLRTIFAEGKPDWLMCSLESDFDAQEIVQMLDTQAYFDLLGVPYPTNQDSVISFLTKAELLIDVGEGKWKMTRLAALLLAKKLSNFPLEIKRKAPRVVLYEGESKLATKSDITGAKGYAVGFQGLVQYVMGLIPQNEIIEDALRKEHKLLPEVAIRELIANALIHQDFEFTGGAPMVEIYSNRVEVSNPGEPLVPVERFIDGYQTRNERMADIMRRMGICEEKSSGVDRVVKTAEEYQLPAPDFMTMHNRTVVVIYGPRSFKEMDRSDRIRACYQHCALQWVLRKRLNNQSLRERFGLSKGSSNTVSQIISHTVEVGLIKQAAVDTESKKFASYVPNWA